MAFLFPGQGAAVSEYARPGGVDLSRGGSGARPREATLADRLERPLGRFLYPGSTFRPEAERANQDAITRADVAQPAIGAVSLGLSRLLESLGDRAAVLRRPQLRRIRRSCAAGAMDEDDLVQVVVSPWRHPPREDRRDARRHGGPGYRRRDRPETILAGLDGISVANSNAPQQTVIAGSEDRLEAAMKRCQERGVRARRLPVACAFHSPLVAPAREPLGRPWRRFGCKPPRRPVYSNVTAARYTRRRQAPSPATWSIT